MLVAGLRRAAPGWSSICCRNLVRLAERRGMRSIRAVCAVFLAIGLLSGPARGEDAPVPSTSVGFIDETEECDSAFVPEKTSIYPVEDDSQVRLEVHFLLDGVPLSKGIASAQFAARPYTRIGIELVPTFEEVTFPADATDANGVSTIDSQRLIDLSREHVGGIRPHGTDVVYTMTSKDLTGPPPVGSAVAGQADCVGAVVNPAEAFAVGEDGEDESDGWNHWAGRVSAHEVGHILGAHHHYANCAEGDLEEAVDTWSTCSVMFNDIVFTSLKFSTVESAAVRGYSLAYANDTPVGPPPLQERTVKLRLTKKRFDGSVSSDRAACTATAAVTLESRTRRRWIPVSEVESDPSGEFTFPLPEKPGRFRASVEEATTHDDSSWFTCSAAPSAVLVARTGA